MRVLFYGGCHATILRFIFDRFAAPGHEFQHLTNFVLIAAQTPFPYEDLRRYDWVVYSPILHQDGYSTETLQAFCNEHAIRTLSFPWLEWRGYFPGVAKGRTPAEPTGWFYPYLSDLALASDSFAAFEQQVFEPDRSDPAVIERTRLADANLDHLTAREAQLGVDLTISPILRAHSAQRRLFLTPDHPSINLYRLLAAQVAERLGLRLGRTLETTAWEPQFGTKTPILPDVHDRLGLLFRDSDCQSERLVGGHDTTDLSGYLQRIFLVSRRLTSFRAKSRTFIKGSATASGDLCDAEKVLARQGDMLMYSDVEVVGTHFMLRHARLNDCPLGQFDRVFIFRPHWERQQAA